MLPTAQKILGHEGLQTRATDLDSAGVPIQDESERKWWTRAYPWAAQETRRLNDLAGPAG
jgi:hypothetical protein